jgi:AcrR family transcriptional regulator
LLVAAEQLFATRGLGVPNSEIVAAAGQHNRSTITYHFASLAGLIDAVRERHETPIDQHRQYLITRLVTHLSHLPEPEALGRVTLTVWFLNSGLARWERDNQPGGAGITPLAPHAPILTDLAIAMLDFR